MEHFSWQEWNAVGASAVLIACLGGFVSSLDWNRVRFQAKFFFGFTLIWCAVFLQAFAMGQAGHSTFFGMPVDAIGFATMPLATFNLSMFVWTALFPRHFLFWKGPGDEELDAESDNARSQTHKRHRRAR